TAIYGTARDFSALLHAPWHDHIRLTAPVEPRAPHGRCVPPRDRRSSCNPAASHPMDHHFDCATLLRHLAEIVLCSFELGVAPAASCDSVCFIGHFGGNGTAGTRAGCVRIPD